MLARDLPAVVRELGPRRALVVALLLTNLVTGPLLTPLFLCVVLVHLARAGLPTPHTLWQVAEATLVYGVIALGGLGTLWCGHVGARARGIAERRVVAAFLPYQLAISLAAWGGLVDLVRRPYHWHKTAHGAAARGASRSTAAAFAEAANSGLSRVKDFERTMRESGGPKRRFEKSSFANVSRAKTR